MAAGTSNYYLAIIGSVFFTIISVILFKSNYGSIYKSQFILRFTLLNEIATSSDHSEIIAKYCQKSTLLQIEPSDELKSKNLTFDLVMKKDEDPLNLTEELKGLDSLKDVVIVASEYDVDY